MSNDLTEKEFNAGVELLNMMALKNMTYGIDSKRLFEICKAEKDGRCFTPPCKVGGAFWYLSNGEVKEDKLNSIGIANNRITYWGNVHVFRDGNIGNTIFFTRKEAKAALKGGDGV